MKESEKLYEETKEDWITKSRIVDYYLDGFRYIGPPIPAKGVWWIDSTIGLIKVDQEAKLYGNKEKSMLQRFRKENRDWTSYLPKGCYEIPDEFLPEMHRRRLEVPRQNIKRQSAKGKKQNDLPVGATIEEPVSVTPEPVQQELFPKEDVVKPLVKAEGQDRLLLACFFTEVVKPMIYRAEINETLAKDIASKGFMMAYAMLQEFNRRLNDGQ